MKATMAPLLLLALAGAALVSAEETSPIAKVVQLLGDEQAKLIAEGKEAQNLYSEFAEMCEERSKDLQFQIKTGNGEVAELKATIEEEGANIESLTAKVEELASELAKDQAELKGATEVRATEKADFDAEEKELLNVIDTLERAVGIIEKEMSKSGASFAQFKNGVSSIAEALNVMVQASVFSSADASRLTALAQSSQKAAAADEDASLGSPAAAVYEGHSGGIIEMLEELKEKAEGQLDKARSEETANLQNFQMLKQSLEDQIAVGNKDTAQAKKDMAASSEKKSVAEGDLAVTSKDLGGDTSALADLHHDCMTKAQDYEAETKSRGEEMTALTKAKEIIVETTSGAADQSYSFVQLSAKLSTRADLVRFEAVRMVRDLAQKQHAPALAQLAARLDRVLRSGTADPFAKIKGLISDMIARLEKEADEDASHNSFCNKEMSETTAKENEKNAEIEKLSTKIEQMSARSAQLKEEVASLQKALADIANTQAEMDKIRAEEKEAYTHNKAEMDMGIAGVKKALKVLEDYYSKDHAHGASEGAGANIIGLLEVCESDFERLLTEMVATEESAAATYTQETKENELETTTKSQDVKYKTKESADLDKAVAEASSDRSGVQTELDAILEYLGKIKEQCVAKAEPYAETKARREAELAGLKSALETLESETALIQRSSRRTLRGVQKHA